MTPPQSQWKIPQIEPWLGPEEEEAVRDAVRSTWITEGPRTSEFEAGIAALTGARHAIAVSNATVGLFMCLKAVGIGPGDEVLVPALTFIATMNAVRMAGAVPILVDVDLKTFNMDPGAVERMISPRSRALIPVHLYGQSADMDQLGALAAAHRLPVIEDAAQAIGVRFRGRHAGTFGRVGVFSFFGNKTITTGEGGAIVTDDDETALRCRMLKNHGRRERGIFTHETVGWNFCFTDLQAAIGIVQLRKLSEIVRRKRRLRDLYQRELANIVAVQFPFEDPRGESVPWFVNILVPDAGALQTFLATRGIQSRRFFYPLHLQPCNEPTTGKFPHTEWAYTHGLSLPSSVQLTDDEIRLVCVEVRSFLAAGHAE